MKKPLIILGITLIVIFGFFYAKRKYYDPNNRQRSATRAVARLAEKGEIQDGDLIFQTSLSRQSKAIQLATKSKYSHCGILYKEGENFFVFEAVQPVKATPLDKWIARGEEGKFVIKRLKNANQILTPSTLQTMKEVGKQFTGKNYDLTFEWSDDKIYCSELIWKIYKRATGLEIGELENLRNFDLSNKAVQKIMKERYGNSIPMDEKVISPVAIFDSELLFTVKSN